MKIEIQPPNAPDFRNWSIELPGAIGHLIERLANPQVLVECREDGIIEYAHEMGPLVSLGHERATMVRPGWVAQVTRNPDGTATITTTKGFVCKVDEDYRSVQNKLGGRPKEAVDARSDEGAGDEAESA